MKLTFLGTGTSTGVPQLRCRCKVCTSDDIRDRRLRTSALIEVEGKNILIDCGPDFREQMLRQGSPSIDAVLLTHEHYDHTGGIDDLRPYSYGEKPLYVYGDKRTTSELLRRQPYCFGMSDYPGVPQLRLKTIGDERFKLEGFNGLEINPLIVSHGKLDVTGYRIGGLSYVTDCLTMPAETLERLRGSDTLVINALRFKSHGSHQTVGEALEIIRKVEPRQAFLVHASHDIGLYRETQKLLPAGVFLAYDEMSVDVMQ